MRKLLLILFICLSASGYSQPLNYYPQFLKNIYGVWDVTTGVGSFNPPTNNIASVGVNSTVKGNVSLPGSGKYYWETIQTGTSNTGNICGVGVVEVGYSTTLILGVDAHGWADNNTARKRNNSNVAYGVTWGVGDVIGTACDIDNGFLYYSKNGVWMNSGNPTSGSTGTGNAFNNIAGKTLWPACSGGTTGSMDIKIITNPTQFTYPMPAGYKAVKN